MLVILKAAPVYFFMRKGSHHLFNKRKKRIISNKTIKFSYIIELNNYNKISERWGEESGEYYFKRKHSR
jgi:hypothetical protein